MSDPLDTVLPSLHAIRKLLQANMRLQITQALVDQMIEEMRPRLEAEARAIAQRISMERLEAYLNVHSAQKKLHVVLSWKDEPTGVKTQ